MSIVTVDDITFQDEFRKSGLRLVDFSAAWCPPCKVLLPILEQLAEQFDGAIDVLKVDCDDAPAAASAYGVMSLPTVILFKDGQPVDKLIGLRPKSVYESALARHM